MTTIAFDGKTMACDTRISGSHSYNTDTKIYENRQFVIGAAGDAGVGLILVKDESILVPKHYDCDFSALVWAKDTKTLYRVEFFKSWNAPLSAVIVMPDPFAATGSGAPYAMAAMHLGCEAGEAVRVASEFDTNTGGKVITKQLLR